jgi:hypothetical protein
VPAQQSNRTTLGDFGRSTLTVKLLAVLVDADVQHDRFSWVHDGHNLAILTRDTPHTAIIPGGPLTFMESSLSWRLPAPAAAGKGLVLAGQFRCRFSGCGWYNACMENTVTLTEADILSEVVAPEDPTLNEEFARAVLSVRFTDAATGRIRDLLQRNNAGTLTPAEKSNREKYMRVGQFIDLMQAKARLSLKPGGSPY